MSTSRLRSSGGGLLIIYSDSAWSTTMVDWKSRERKNLTDSLLTMKSGMKYNINKWNKSKYPLTDLSRAKAASSSSLAVQPFKGCCCFLHVTQLNKSQQGIAGRLQGEEVVFSVRPVAATCSSNRIRGMFYTYPQWLFDTIWMPALRAHSFSLYSKSAVIRAMSYHTVCHNISTNFYVIKK